MKRDLFPSHGRVKGDKKPSTFGRSQAIKPKRITNDLELEFNNWLHSEAVFSTLKCFVCGKSAECIHHIKKHSHDKKNHFKQIPLCTYHHIGDGLSPHGKSVLWRETYSMDEQILEAVKLETRWLKERQ